MIVVLALTSALFSYDGTIRAGQTLTIRDIAGNVNVRSGERLAVRATKHAQHGDPNAVAVRVDQRRGGIVVCVRYPPNANRPCDDRPNAEISSDNDTQVDFEVTIPSGVALDASTVSGRIEAHADGPIDVASVNGTVVAEGRDVRSARTVNGSVRVRVLDRSGRALDAKTVNGSIDVSLPPGSGVTLKAKTVTGSISAEGVRVDRFPYGPGASASGTLGDGARHVTLEAVNGSITLKR